ncbi:RNA-binding S4 domain-containing protein [Actinorugispora endophytica]|uniref:Heat shock protein Hsp15 n=1 Tax=Actinorugispora endophytica TaxID=1605990 RepID=A0A4R6V2M3_9ACTN|nr:S4 domain-containing protein [Actinorugispora endophytica]TDQ54424.1 heat shock protein Hsp15 [Actinorugispora endophytica]
MRDQGQDPAAAGPAAAPERPLPPGPPSGRVDRWLWAVRLTKTRADAAGVCRAGHVKVNDKPAKPATPVRAGDVVRAHINGTTRIIEVAHVIEKRVGAPLAVRCYVDNTPVLPPEAAVPVARRARGAGRPTKRDRRRLDRLRGDGGDAL